MSTIDLNNPPPNHNYKVSVEREETAGERWVRLTKDLALFFAALLVFGMIEPPRLSRRLVGLS
ncbi:hypothetical protein CYD94_09085 [Ralstonia solanacearum]|uniref:hypothetical protein n=1 Tax=Ralstonia pseudosolanacearum TaxID=1310165 RepID=UPI000C9FF2BD|nr:hypothetical protein [Ralstonia pseudosolanacearum]AUS42324.1 hypothetical protein CYD94_09085 [Ralstonia solanacearum]